MSCVLTGALLAACGSVRAWADGCFVFKWNKAIDINEPAQKAIVFHAAGREDLLLQVKYEGALADFGWLIPTPTLPKVEQGKMEPFYELSQLTQKHFGTFDHEQKGPPTLGLVGAHSAEERVKVIEVKTVGAYEVSILSAQDAESLRHWLQAHDYSVPKGKSGILDEYTRKGWYFVAAKVELNHGLGFKAVSAASPKDAQSAAKARKALQSKLSSGELHPLLISFDTPKAVFPLKISAVGGKPSEVSLYLLAAEPLLNGFIFEQAVAKLGRQAVQWEAGKSARAQQTRSIREYPSTMRLGFFLDSFYSNNPREPLPAHLRDYTPEDLLALAREEEGPIPTEQLGMVFYAPPGQLLQCLRLTNAELPACARTFSRLKAGEWYLTKQVYTFTPAEMRDLEFEPAFPALARTLSQPAGGVAAQALAQLGPKGHPCFAQACSSTNPVERLNAVVGIQSSRSPGFGDSVAGLLKDPVPAIRLGALRAAEANPERRFVDTVVDLLRDPELEVRQEAGGYLSNHEPPERTPFYLTLMRDADPKVRRSAPWIASWINRYATSEAVFQEALRLLKDPDDQVRLSALHALYQMHDKEVPRADLLPFLSSPFSVVRGEAYHMLPPAPPGPDTEKPTLAPSEMSGLLTNRTAKARLEALKALSQIGDAEAVERILPLLTDPNKLVRHRAFFVLRKLTGQELSDTDASKWQAWWQANKASFRPKPAAPDPTERGPNNRRVSRVER